MSSQDKQLSNPFSTGGGGVNFETRVQAAFVVLMLTRGFIPCLPAWPIRKIKLQGKYAGFDTDDLIVFTTEPNGEREAKLLAQIKHSISITKTNKTFGEVIQAAWKDFINPEIFTFGRDVFALITGPLSATDTDDVRTILEWARHSEGANDFITKVKQANFSSESKRTKLKAFQTQLKKANKGQDVTDEQLWKFMRSFYLLGYDLDIKAGVTLSLLHSLIGQYSAENVQSLWSSIVDEVQFVNQNAGTIDVETLPQDIGDLFKERAVQTIPESFVTKAHISKETGWSQIEYAAELALAALIGGWSESSDADMAVVEKLAGGTYAEWVGKIRNILLKPGSPLALKDGKWNISVRGEAWTALGPRLFDEHLDRFKEIAVDVLRERNPALDLPPDERSAASLYGKVLSHSPTMRKGIAESLALLGSRPEALTSCSLGKTDIVAVLAVREILAGVDWSIWASLSNLLPLLAEAAPNEFLNAIEAALNDEPSPFDELFAQESDGITGQNYMSGILWALEGLAWDEQYLTRVTVILGDLAARDPGGSWSNRPANSLSTIFLPWLPQTLASIPKRKNAVETLQKEFPDVAWNLLLALLPNAHQISTGSHKPTWRKLAPEEQTAGVTRQEYREQVTGYADLAIHAAKSNTSKLVDLIERLDDIPPSSREQLLEYLGSDEIADLPETDRLPLWTELTSLLSKHKKYADAKWAMKPKQLDAIADVAKRLEPESSLALYQRLFSDRDFDLFEGKGDWEEQRKELEDRRRKAIAEIFALRGVGAVLEFVNKVESSWQVGLVFGSIAIANVDQEILPGLLEMEQKPLIQFTYGYVRGRYYGLGWPWVDQLEISQWTLPQISQLLVYLPFTLETWIRSAKLLGDQESCYWTSANVNPYEADNGLILAIDKLVEYSRPYAAIKCLYKIIISKQPVEASQVVKVLFAALNSSEDIKLVERREVVKLIQALQNDPSTNPDDLFRVEWSYLPLLDRDQGASPKLLELRLANSPDFFCELIRIVFRSKKEERITKESTEEEKNIATNAYRLLTGWRILPGTQEDGSFSGEALTSWLAKVKESCAESGHLEVALTMVGQVLMYAPPDPDGLWIHHSVAESLNEKDAGDMRKGFRLQIINSRGVHWVDPTGRPERELAEKYRNQADDAESHSYHRLAATLRELAEWYDHEADRISRESTDE